MPHRAVSTSTVDYSRIDAVERQMHRTAAEVDLAMGKHLSGLASIAATAPFVGLFGTSIGIVNSFRGSDGDKSTILAALTGLLSESLVPTALSLLVAIVAWCGYQYFTTRMEAFKVEMKNGSSELLTYLATRSPALH
jgi:biopolymer transport protein ExbB/TolQ